MYKKYEHASIAITTGDSNLAPFYTFIKDNVEADASMDWNFFILSDIKVYFSIDMTSAILTFNGDGSYNMNIILQEGHHFGW